MIHNKFLLFFKKKEEKENLLHCILLHSTTCHCDSLHRNLFTKQNLDYKHFNVSNLFKSNNDRI